MDKQFLSTFKGVKDPALMFDLICVANYFAGMLEHKMPVDENREIFQRIKKLLN